MNSITTDYEKVNSSSNVVSDLIFSGNMSFRNSNVTLLESYDFANVTSVPGNFSVTSLGTDDFANVTTVTGNFSATSLESDLANVTTSLEGEFEFNRRLLLNVIAYSIMFIVGTIGNTLVGEYL
jgi:hypothetical protein